MTGCCVPMCTNNSRNGWKLYHFPTEPKRRLLWMVKIKRDKWQPTKSSCVCSAHFEASHFEQHRADQWIKLKPNAVPTVFPFRGLPPQRKAPKDRAGPAVLPDACQETRGDNSTAINCTPLTSAQANLNSRTDSLGAQQPQSCNSQTPDSVPHIMEREEVVISADAPDGARENKQLNKQLSDMGRKYTQLHQVHRKATSTIQALKKQVKKLETKMELFGQRLKFLNDDQLQALGRQSNKGSTWSAETIKQALQIKFSCGKTGYQTLRNLGYPLPSGKTLARRLQGLKFLPGILTEVIDVLKIKAENMQDIEKDCALFLDEMEIARGYELDRAEDVVLGGQTMPENPDEPAHHALVFMVGGLNTRWKQVIAYHFTGSHVEGSILKDYVMKIVQLCAEISLRIRVVTCDMGASNRAMWRELGFSSHRNSITVCSVPHPCLEDKELFFTADAAHVLKNVKSQLLSSEVFFLSDATVCQHNLPSKEVNVDHVRSVIKYDAERELKVAPRLSELHISRGHFTKMKVGVAVRFFREAPAAIRYLIKEDAIEPEAETTAWFLELVFNWYTLMSSRHPSVALSLRDMRRYHESIELLNSALEVFQGMKMGSKAQWKPSQAGFLITTKVVLRLQDILLRSEGYEFFLTSRILQDCLENLFSVVRIRKPVPNAYDLKCALKLVCVSQFLHAPGTSSYEVDDAKYLADMLAKGKQEHGEVEADVIDDSEILFIEELQENECNILFYIGGFLLKGMLSVVAGCGHCNSALLGSTESEHATLTILKEYRSEGGNLTYPSKDVLLTLKSCEEHFRGIISWSEGLLRLRSPLKAVTDYLNEMVRPCVKTCSEHSDAVAKLLIANYARLRLRVHLRHVSSNGVNEHGSKTCAGVSLP
ncbi:uncharacterized protein LOC142818019 [Rhipicephalus microplus]|uniref:uncharacterized protein LOC142818019 n=1 Tax=Rhipicephalus microplus TaxID=6941 RepID=UPI003F6C8D2E